MDFYKRESLPILEIPADTESIPWSSLERALLQHPCKVVFIETGGILQGLISFGDMRRAKKEGLASVPINREFHKINAFRFFEAREFFQSCPQIKELPVVDQNGCLKGMCSKLDDLLYMEYSEPWKKNRYTAEHWRKYPVVFLADPSSEDIRRRNLLQRWEECLQEAGVVCHHISVDEAVKQFNREGPILVTDEEMRLGIKLLIEVFREKELIRGNTFTLKEAESRSREHTIDELIMELSNAGITVFNMMYTLDESTHGRKRIIEGFRKWEAHPDARIMAVKVLPSQAPAFYRSLYTEEYARRVGSHLFYVEKNTVYAHMKDFEDEYFHIKNGERLTLRQPEYADRTIWFFGQCIVVGSYVEDQHTIESYLQDLLNQGGYSAKVVNYGCFESWYQEMIHITSTPMKPGDIIVMYVENKPYEGTTTLDLTDILDRHQVPSEWLLNNPLHCNREVNEIYAKELYKRMVRDGVLKSPANQSDATRLTRNQAIQSLYLDIYFSDYTPCKGERVGTISLLGDPFTLGHRYLIETASRKVDHLFVFLIEDELGFFSYAERFAMAVDATRDLPNVTIVSGGPFQGTRNVFRKGLMNDDLKNLENSIREEILDYTEVIAPSLGVSYRFFGKENHNPNKVLYHDMLKKLLPQYGIETIELPKAVSNGKEISASTARKAAAEGDLVSLRVFVPVTTLRYFGIGSELEE